MQTGLGLDRSLSHCVYGGMGCRDSVTTGITHYPCTLSGLEENSTSQLFSIVILLVRWMCPHLRCWAPVRWTALRKGPPSIAVMPPEGGGGVLSVSASVKSAQLLPGSLSGRPEGSGIDVSSAAPSTTVVFHERFFWWMLPVTYIHILYIDWMLGLSVLQQLLMRSIIGWPC